MNRRILLPALALLGIGLTIFMVVTTSRKPKHAAPVEAPSRAPFLSYVSGSGLVEPASQSVQIASNTSGIVSKVFVQPGSQVRKGDPLWQIDPSSRLSQLDRDRASLAQAQASLAKDRAGTQPEEIQKQQEQIRQAQAQVDDANSQLALRESAANEDQRAVSIDEINQSRNLLRQREASLKFSQVELDRLKRGTWAPDLKIQEAAVATARAQVEQTQTDLNLLTVRSPLDGEVFQVNVHVGEFAPAGQSASALMVVGSRSLNVRAQIDENDVWRVQAGAPAVAFPRGQDALQFPLQFVRFDPFVIPKKSLTGDSTERVDTRVLEIIYRLPGSSDRRVFAGQQMDVYVQAPSLNGAFLQGESNNR